MNILLDHALRIHTQIQTQAYKALYADLVRCDEDLLQVMLLQAPLAGASCNCRTMSG
jgi:hypothetical protein